MYLRIKTGVLIFSALFASLFFKRVDAQISKVDFERLLQVPLQYTVLRTTGQMTIDGKDDEPDWSKAPWTEFFTDIKSGADSNPLIKSHCKMLWDDDYLYLFVSLDETNLWASLTEHDSPVFQDNAFEMFIDPSGTNFNYFEFQINAYGTVWDLFMPKPYRNGGKNLTSWDLKGLKKAVQLNGTINNPNDTDQGWSIELAVPFKSLNLSGDQPPGIGTTWRMNFSRVKWDIDTLNGSYHRRKDINTGKPLPEHYNVWSPQGIVNLHCPERWGYVQFSDQLSPKGFLSEKTEKLKLILWKYYYLQQEFKRVNGKYSNNLKQLKKMYKDGPSLNEKDFEIKLYADEYQFLIKGSYPGVDHLLSVDEEGELNIDNLSK
ncbi:carbohydrate-binding family 9-like protein [Ginsengibacter hankyongi]|uniref:Carbohydrate-binding family 9-like protein n=1 Tax=Ginsengibacter hankyongi TaxID=2607284 RepID=A0A5J5IDL0_9BACT|nr:carbohydrate-binding family 9-like protein [Ginsengibacter hankyongi]KAA9037712.1 carbohydrate-binding family 9-like protein [Ginsengibacter hankyongi]